MAASLQKNTNYKASGEAATTVLQLDEDAVDIQEVVWTEKEEAALVRKIDRGLMPVLCISTAMHYYAKAVISQAAIFGIRGDLKLNTGNRFSMATSIFYLGYMAGSYPITHLAQRFPVEMVLGATVTATGVCVILTGLCHNYQSLYAARFILGMFQGSNPVFALITGCWYKKKEQPFRIGVWTSFLGWAGVVVPLINHGIGSIDGSLSSWRYIFFVAGSIITLWGLLLPFLLSPNPQSARGIWLRLSTREQDIAVHRLRENNTGLPNVEFKMEQVTELLVDFKFWLIVVAWFFSQLVSAPINYFGPIIIKGLGYNSLNSLLLTIPIGATGGISILVGSWLPHLIRNARCNIIAVAELFACLGALLVWQLPRTATGGQLVGLYILPTVGATSSLIISLQLANSAGYTKRSASSAALFMAFCLGNFVGPLLFRGKDAPDYIFGFIWVVISSGIAACLSQIYRFSCVWHNLHRDKAGTTEAFNNAFNNDMTDIKNKEFRYTV